MTAPAKAGYKQAQRELHALNEVAKALNAAQELSALLSAVMSKLVNVLDPAEVGVITIWDDGAGLFRPAAAFGYDLELLHKVGYRAGEAMSGKVYDAGRARLFKTPAEVAAAMADLRPANAAAIARALGSQKLPISAVGAPLRVGERKLGVLELHTLRGPAEFTENDLPFVQTLADLIALAIDRDRLLQQANVIRDAQQAERLRSEVMANLSHELRTSLGALKGYTTALLLEEVLWSEEKRTDFLTLIDEECDNMDAMIQEVLSASLIETGQFTLEKQPLRLPILAREVAEQMQRRTEIHQLIVDFPPGFPIVDADHLRIRQVLRVILDNAIKYSPDGGRVLIRGETRAQEVVICLSDQGVGISPENLIPLFEKYFRVRAPTGYHVAGTGLGLPVARAIVIAHAGRIWAESKVGEGTSLYFSLPYEALPGSARA
ncbi:MAG: ATP-binding protein [Anaerolineales bacterium]|nr:ATP-binding protein [Anaerolineales bacterium]